MSDSFSCISINCLRNREELNDMRYLKVSSMLGYEGTPSQNHILKMIEWIEKFTSLGMVLKDNLCVDLVL